MNPLDTWRDQLRSDPARSVAGVLEGWLDRGPWQRTEPVDFLLDLADADVSLSETTADALLAWTKEKLTWDDRRRLRYGERAHAGQLADALATLQRLKAPHADYQLAEQHPWLEARLRPLRFDEHMDLPRLLWLTTAFIQPDERFLTRWLEMCGQAARLAPGWREWLRVGLTGLRKLRGNTLPAEQQALAGLLLFEHKIKPPYPQEATQFAARQFEVLKELFHRGPQYWPSVMAEVRERLPENRVLPAWMPSEPRKNKPNGEPVAPPVLQDVQRMARRIRNEPITEVLWHSVIALFRQRHEHARHTGESEFLIKTVSNLGNELLERHPAPDILRGLLAWIRSALDWDAGNAYLWTRLASCYQALGRVTAAEDSLWETMRRFPEDYVSRTILAELLRDKGETSEAETLLRETMRRFPDNAHCRTILVQLLWDKDEKDEANALLRETLKRHPDNEVALTLLDNLHKHPDGYDKPRQYGYTDGQRSPGDEATAPLDDDPLIPWAAERAPLIRLLHGIGQPDGIHEALLQAARSGGAAELAEAALRLLFPDEALPLEDTLRARPDSLALRLFQTGQDAALGLRLAETAPEAESVLRALYRADADPSTWDVRFRDAVLACADLTPPPAWRGVLA